MSDAKPSTGPSRGKVYLPLGVGESVGLPLSEWAYRTPSHPQGLKGSGLRDADPTAQREVMLVWFLQNFIPETGPVFGFAEAAAPPEPTPIGSGYGKNYGNAFGQVEIGGWDQAPFSTGVPALDLLTAEFVALVDDVMLATVSGVVPGLWVSKPHDLSPDADQTLAELSSTLLALLDKIDGIVRGLPVKSVGRGHNRSPEGLVDIEGLPDELHPVTVQERDTVLRATADVRLAMSSHDQSALSIAWQATLSALEKIGKAVTSQIRMLYADGPAATALRTGAAGLAISLVGMELNLINQAGAAGIIVAAIGAKMLSKKS